MAKKPTPPPAHPDVIQSPEAFIAPSGQPIRGQQFQQTPAFPPELQVALQHARDKTNGRYMIAVFEAENIGNDLVHHLHLTCGPEWTKPESYLRAFQLFVAEHHKITPEMLAMVEAKPVEVAPEFPPAKPVI